MSGKAGAIAIDGQAAAGKTAVGRELALRLGCPFLDTGIMYRAVTWLAIKEGVAMEDERRLSQLASSSTMQPSDQEANGLVLNGITLGTELRTAEVDQHVSLVARVSGVRQEMVRQQRDISARARQESGGIVMVGRDIGTVVLPDADLKVFMVASPQVRAQRRYDELVSQGHPADYRQILDNAMSRDRIDSQRADSPLAQAADALLVDTSDLTIDQVVEKILERLGSPVGRTVR
ncbi:MAG: (d)CMP kinase [Chloroflexi bacterium]|nr:(d)CMP kinase [Chloroflexota bacterium]